MARCSAALTDAQTAEPMDAKKFELMAHWWVVSSAAKMAGRWVEMKGASTADKKERM